MGKYMNDMYLNGELFSTSLDSSCSYYIGSDTSIKYDTSFSYDTSINYIGVISSLKDLFDTKTGNQYIIESDKIKKELKDLLTDYMAIKSKLQIYELKNGEVKDNE